MSFFNVSHVVVRNGSINNTIDKTITNNINLYVTDLYSNITIATVTVDVCTANGRTTTKLIEDISATSSGNNMYSVSINGTLLGTATDVFLRLNVIDTNGLSYILDTQSYTVA